MTSESNVSLLLSSASKSQADNSSDYHKIYERNHDPDEPARNDKGARIIYCRLCRENVHKSFGVAGVSNFKRHLETNHGIRRPQSQSSSQSELFSVDSILKAVSKLEDQDALQRIYKAIQTRFPIQGELEEKLIELTVRHSLPLSMIEWEELQEIFGLTYSAVKLPTRQTFVKRIIDLWKDKKGTLQQRLQLALSKIHISVDIWTSPNSILFLGVCGHFVDSNGSLKNLLLDMISVSGHSGDDQFEIIRQVLQEYDIAKKLGVVIGDNSSTNDTLCRNIETFLDWEGSINWRAESHRLRCIGHIINLIVQAFLFKGFITEKKLQSAGMLDPSQIEGVKVVSDKSATFRKLGALGKLHNIVVHIRSSPSRTKEFKKHANKLIPLDNATRWNSWYQMLATAIEIKSAVDTYLENHMDTLEQDQLDRDDWSLLRNMASVLKVFDSSTLIGEGDSGLLHRAIFVLDVLKRHLIYVSEDDKYQPDIHSRTRNALTVLNQYRDKIMTESPYYMAAIALHPSYRAKYFEVCWTEEDRKRSNWESELQRLWSQYKAKYQPPSPSEDPLLRPKRSKTKDNDQYIESLLQEFSPSYNSDEDEWATFQKTAPLKIECSPLTWWLQPEQQRNWPCLATMAIDILSIPAMSDEPERVFSGGRHTISWERMRLGEQSIQATECLKSWFKEDI